MEYRPRGKARTLSDIPDVVKWVEEELDTIARAGGEVDRSAMRVWNTEPPRPREGNIVWADGTNWNPGHGKGPYTYLDGEWVPMFNLHDTVPPMERTEQSFPTETGAVVLELPEINGVVWMAIGSQFTDAGGNAGSYVKWYEKDADTGLYDPTPKVTWTNANFGINAIADMKYGAVGAQHFLIVVNYADNTDIVTNSFFVEITADGAGLAFAKHTALHQGAVSSVNVPTIGGNNASFIEFDDGQIYATFANEGDSVQGWTQNSLVYKWISGSSQWQFYQAFSGVGCRHLLLLETPTLVKQLVRVQFYTGSTHRTSATIHSFIDDANGWNTTASQTIPIDGGCYCEKGVDQDGRAFIWILCREEDQNIFAIESPVRLWTGAQWDEFARIRTSGAIMARAFNDADDKLYFAQVNNLIGDGAFSDFDRGSVRIYRVDLSEFTPIYSFRAQAPFDVEYTTVEGKPAFIIAESALGNTRNDIEREVDSTLRSLPDLTRFPILAWPDIAEVPLFAKHAVFGGSITNVSGTVYLNTLGQFASEAAARMPMPFYGRVRRLRTVAGNVPGAGQSYTYTLFIAGAATAMTFAVSGAGQNVGELSFPAVPFADGFSWSIQLVATAGAAATTHTFSMYLEPT